MRLRSVHANDADGPLGLATLKGTFPIENDLVEARQEKFGFKRCTEQFVQNRGWYTDARPGFPTADIEEERTCGAVCCQHIVQEDGPTDAKELLNYIRLTLKHAAKGRKNTGLAAVVDPTTLIRFECCNPTWVKYYLVALAERLNNTLFEATFFEMQPLPQRRNLACLTETTLQFVQGTTGTDGTPWPWLLTELEVTSKLIGLKLNKSQFSLPPSAAKGSGPIPAGLA